MNGDKFEEYLNNLRTANGTDKIALFLDNLSCHISDRAKETMRKHGFKWIYNVPFSP